MIEPRYVIDRVSPPVGWAVQDRNSRRRVGLFFVRWRARQYRDWLNEGEKQEPEFHYDPELEELCNG